MSILRYEHPPPVSGPKAALTAPAAAWLVLLLIVVGSLLTLVGCLVLAVLPGWSLILLPWLSQVPLFWFVVRPMGQHVYRQPSWAALAVVIVGLGYHVMATLLGCMILMVVNGRS